MSMMCHVYEHIGPKLRRRAARNLKGPQLPRLTKGRLPGAREEAASDLRGVGQDLMVLVQLVLRVDQDPAGVFRAEDLLNPCRYLFHRPKRIVLKWPEATEPPSCGAG